ncbi:MAG: GNAT family N-acetyltransferase [Verrucomicrobia bacterium]|nr:GNAT family N-acetyltransferase [Leptolyngbya sp. ES-bin-22]
MVEIETDRLQIRPFTLIDLDALAATWGDPEVMRYIGSGQTRSRSETKASLERIIEHQEQDGFSLWAVDHKADGKLLGFCGLKSLDDTAEIEIGWRLAKAYWGRGLATEGAKASLEYGFEVLEMNRIVAVANPANAASRRVMEKIGLQYEKEARYYNTDCVYYALNRDQWNASSNGSTC